MEQTTHTGGKNKGARRRKFFPWTKSSSKTDDDDDDECLQVTRLEFGALLRELKKAYKKLKEAIEDSSEAEAREGFRKKRQQDLERQVNALQEELKRHEQKEKMFKFGEALSQRKIRELEDKLKRMNEFDKYEMSRRPRGICLIINNLHFRASIKNRWGAEVDESGVKELFEELFFTVHSHKNLRWDEMRKVAVEFAAKDHSKFDAFVFIVMSHGGDKDVISGVNGRHIRIEDLMSEFKATNCPTLLNKPKMFFIQACRGSMQECLAPTPDVADSTADFSPDSTLPRSVCPQEADFLLSFATAPGYVAWRDRSGSRFIQILVQAIRKHHKNHHLLDILTEVNKRVVESGRLAGGVQNRPAIQVPAPTHTLRAQLFL